MYIVFCHDFVVLLWSALEMCLLLLSLLLLSLLLLLLLLLFIIIIIIINQEMMYVTNRLQKDERWQRLFAWRLNKDWVSRRPVIGHIFF